MRVYEDSKNGSFGGASDPDPELEGRVIEPFGTFGTDGSC